MTARRLALDGAHAAAAGSKAIRAYVNRVWGDVNDTAQIRKPYLKFFQRFNVKTKRVCNQASAWGASYARGATTALDRERPKTQQQLMRTAGVE